MLRNHQHDKQSLLRRQNRLKETHGEGEPEGEDDAGDTNPPVTQAQARRRFLQFLRG